MTLIRDDRQPQVTCDTCPASFRHIYPEAEFLDLMTDIQSDGWRPRKVAGAWHHTCPDCSKTAERRLL